MIELVKKWVTVGGIGFLTIGLFIGCQESTGPDEPPINGSRTLTIGLHVPGMSVTPTYALDATDECELETLDVLVFNAADSTFLYHTEGTNICVPNPKNPNVQTFDIRITQTTNPNKVFLMLIANAHQVVTKAQNALVIAKGQKREAILKGLLFSVSSKWPVKPGPFTRFPMWGESAEIDLSGVIQVESIQLIRSVAKIDVGINYNESTHLFAGLGTRFKLETIHLYQSHKELQVCPNSTQINATRNGVKGPSIPATAGVNTPIEYVVNGQNDNPNKIAFTDRIYTPEHEKEKVCLVIGGYYSASGSIGTTLSYYRIDFLQTGVGTGGEPTEQFLTPLLRNHLYRINITAVHGPGHATKEAALAATASNLVVQFTDDDLNETVYNQHYSLGVTPLSWSCSKEAQKGLELTVRTTHSGGWTAASTVGWLSLQQTSGSNTNQRLVFNLAANTTNGNRTGQVTVQAGTLSKVVTVVQAPISAFEVAGVAESYVLNAANNYSFTVKSLYDWQVKIDDPSVILRTFTTSGVSSTAGTPFRFTLMNKSTDATATVVFYSLTEAFEPVEITINGISQ
ncbi:MAG: hypothetical protein EOM31_02660 [Bacteroidia bacterium]|nr:hypothetical protein [Bacteroidia bacterium]